MYTFTLTQYVPIVLHCEHTSELFSVTSMRGLFSRFKKRRVLFQSNFETTKTNVRCVNSSNWFSTCPSCSTFITFKMDRILLTSRGIDIFQFLWILSEKPMLILYLYRHPRTNVHQLSRTNWDFFWVSSVICPRKLNFRIAYFLPKMCLHGV